MYRRLEDKCINTDSMKIDWPIDDDRMYVTLQCKYTGLHLSVRKLEIIKVKIDFWLPSVKSRQMSFGNGSEDI